MPTKPRAMRIPEDLWLDALKVAEQRGETVTAVVVAALKRYVQRNS